MTGCSALVSDARALMFLNRCSRSCMPRAISPAACVFSSSPPPECSALVATGDKSCLHVLTPGRPRRAERAMLPAGLVVKVVMRMIMMMRMRMRPGPAVCFSMHSSLCRLRKGSCSLRAQGPSLPQCCGSRANPSINCAPSLRHRLHESKGL